MKTAGPEPRLCHVAGRGTHSERHLSGLLVLARCCTRLTRAAKLSAGKCSSAFLAPACLRTCRPFFLHSDAQPAHSINYSLWSHSSACLPAVFQFTVLADPSSYEAGAEGERRLLLPLLPSFHLWHLTATSLSPSSSSACGRSCLFSFSLMCVYYWQAKRMDTCRFIACIHTLLHPAFVPSCIYLHIHSFQHIKRA